MTKWDKICELCNHVYEDDTLEDCDTYMKALTYAPNIGCRIWIFTYKGILVGMYDKGNGHYDFHSVVTVLDLLIAKFLVSTRWFRKGY